MSYWEQEWQRAYMFVSSMNYSYHRLSRLYIRDSADTRYNIYYCLLYSVGEVNAYLK